jgi:hypothetical protein
MTHQNLNQLSEIISASKEPIEVDLQPDRLTIRTKKNSFQIFLSVFGIAFAVLLVLTKQRGQYNLGFGLVFLWMSLLGFWRVQNINKTLIIDLTRKTISIIPNFILQRWILAKLLKVDQEFAINNLPDLQLLFYRTSKYHWSQRIYFKKVLWNVYLLEFDKKETAQLVLNLLKR